MEKKDYMTPVISCLGPDVNECMEINSPMTAAVTMTSNAVLATSVSRVW